MQFSELELSVKYVASFERRLGGVAPTPLVLLSPFRTSA